MKRFVVAIVLILCVFAECFLMNFFAEKAVEETKQALLSCTEKEDDVSKIKIALNIWDKNEKILQLFMTDDDFSEFESNMVLLQYLCDFPMHEEIARISGESVIVLEKSKKKIRLNAKNIF